jgi:hypothetical protein
MIKFHGNSSDTPKKERYTSILSNSSIKVLSSSTNLDSDLKKSNFAPFTPTTVIQQVSSALTSLVNQVSVEMAHTRKQQ